MGELPAPAEHNPCTFFFLSNFFAGAEWDYGFNFMFDYDIENDMQNMCIIRSWDRRRSIIIVYKYKYDAMDFFDKWYDPLSTSFLNYLVGQTVVIWGH